MFCQRLQEPRTLTLASGLAASGLPPPLRSHLRLCPWQRLRIGAFRKLRESEQVSDDIASWVVIAQESNESRCRTPQLLEIGSVDFTYRYRRRTAKTVQ